MKIDSVKYKAFKGSSWRFDPSFHLSEANKVFKTLKRSPYALTDINNCSERVFLGNIFSRVFVKDSSHGIPYLAASDTVLSNIDTGAFLSKKQVEALSYLKLEKDWILVTCSGTVGNVTYTNKCFENHIATHDLIRIVPSDKTVKRGCLYAYLSSKYGHCLLTQSKFGGVVKHINDDHVKNVPIPQFPVKFQEKVDNLVKESARLREDAFSLMQKGQSLIQRLMCMNGKSLVHSTTLKKIKESLNVRFEGNYYVGDGREIYNFIKKNLNSISLRDCTQKIFKPGIFKRSYVEKKGVPLLGGADIMKAIPSSNKLISKKQVSSNSELKIEKDWILVTRAGTIGNTIYVDDQVASQVVSEDVLRIVPQKDSYLGYIYAFLCSEYGKKMINMFTYGSVIQHIEAAHLEEILIPQFEKKDMAMIDDLTRQSVAIIENAKQKELQAISLVEKEIDGWNA